MAYTVVVSVPYLPYVACTLAVPPFTGILAIAVSLLLPAFLLLLAFLQLPELLMCTLRNLNTADEGTRIDSTDILKGTVSRDGFGS